MNEINELYDGDKDEDNDIKIHPEPEHIASILYSPGAYASIKEFYEVLLKGTGPYIFGNNEREIKANSLSSGYFIFLNILS